MKYIRRIQYVFIFAGTRWNKVEFKGGFAFATSSWSSSGPEGAFNNTAGTLDSLYNESQGTETFYSLLPISFHPTLHRGMHSLVVRTKNHSFVFLVGWSVRQSILPSY